MKTKVNPDLGEEREKVEFNVEEFTNWFFGGEDKVQEKRFLENYFLETPELKDKSQSSYMSHKELYEDGIRRTAIVLKKLKELERQGMAKADLRSEILAGLFAKAIFPEGSPLSVHYDMFIPGLKSMGTPEQQKRWVDKAYNCEIIGAYAQTELGHGTNIRGLETTATYDPKSREFVINSPTITAYKWWPGGLGHTANCAIIMAQLWSLGKCLGIHPFYVQIRDFDTHKPLKGITIGEIGSKIGFNTVNNGFLGFDRVRIPLDQMLMKNYEILANGEYKKKKSSILAYGTMTYIRVGILNKCLRLLAQATIIVTRYSLVRRQSPINPDEPEPKIIDHVTQQQKIFPQIAKVIVFNLASKKLKSFYDEVMAELERGKLDRLPDLHALSCCLKAVSSTEATDGIQALRLACGGHGYLNSAGINALFKTSTAAQTYEGENTVLLLQTARYLMKAWKQALNGEKLPPTVAYLSEFVRNSELCGSWDGSPHGVLKGFQATAAGKIRKAYESFAQKQKTMSLPEAMNRCGIDMTKAAELHCQVFLIETATKTIHESCKGLSPAICYLLRDVLEMFAVDVSYRYLGDLQQYVRMTAKDLDTLQLRREFCLQKLRVNAIGIVDGFDYPDEYLNSTLGAYDGNVYERLLEAAKASPLNQEDVNKSFEMYLKPFMKSNL